MKRVSQKDKSYNVYHGNMHFTINFIFLCETILVGPNFFYGHGMVDKKCMKKIFILFLTKLPPHEFEYGKTHRGRLL
jgi:hypothetical protein